MRESSKKKNIKPNIPYRKNRKDKQEIDKGSYKERDIIERLFLKLKSFRRLSTKFEKTVVDFLLI